MCICILSLLISKIKDIIYLPHMNVGKINKLVFAKAPRGVKRDERGGFIFWFLAGLAFSGSLPRHRLREGRPWPLRPYERPWGAEMLYGRMAAAQQGEGQAPRLSPPLRAVW